MRVPIPPEVAQQISQRAVQHARENIKGLGWSDRSVEALEPYSSTGEVGIRTTLKFLMYQERGTRPFIMWWVRGRKVPIHDSSGTHVVTGVGPGTPGWVTLPGGIRKWRDQRWRHPGLQAQSFMAKGLEQAINEYRPELKKKVLRQILHGGK